MCGFLVQPDPVVMRYGSGVGLAFALGLGQLLGQKAKARIHAEFSIDRARERFESIYQHITRKEQP